MVTPKEFKENLKNGTITVPMIDEVLFSINKRAKNWRDKESKYRRQKYDIYGNEEKAEANKIMLYEKKSEILSFCQSKLVAVHKLLRKRKIRIEDTDEEFDNYTNDINLYKQGKKSNVVYMNDYCDEGEWITFINVIIDDPEYYLYYEFPNHSYHHPIDIDELEQYDNLEIIEINELTTYGKDINDLLSLQFCDKVLNLLREKKLYI